MITMNDKEIEKLLKSIDAEAVPPEGLKEEMLVKTLALEYQAESVLTPFERFLFEMPLRAACAIAITISGSLWAVFGSGFSKLLMRMIG